MNTSVLASAAVSAVLALSVPVFADPPPGETPDPLVAAAEQLVDALVQEDFDAAVAQFGPTLRRALPEAKLQSMWRNLKAQVGPFRERLGVRVDQQRGLKVVFVACEFRDFLLEAKVVFNAAGEVDGLFFAPPPKSG